MSLLASAMTGMETVLLPLASVLLLEELTYGGMVRLLLAPRPETGKQGGPHNHTGEGK